MSTLPLLVYTNISVYYPVGSLLVYTYNSVYYTRGATPGGEGSPQTNDSDWRHKQIFLAPLIYSMIVG